jgi:hypothetical protein
VGQEPMPGGLGCPVEFAASFQAEFQGYWGIAPNLWANSPLGRCVY